MQAEAGVFPEVMTTQISTLVRTEEANQLELILLI